MEKLPDFIKYSILLHLILYQIYSFDHAKAFGNFGFDEFIMDKTQEGARERKGKKCSSDIPSALD